MRVKNVKINKNALKFEINFTQTIMANTRGEGGLQRVECPPLLQGILSPPWALDKCNAFAVTYSKISPKCF